MGVFRVHPETQRNQSTAPPACLMVLPQSSGLCLCLLPPPVSGARVVNCPHLAGSQEVLTSKLLNPLRRLMIRVIKGPGPVCRGSSPPSSLSHLTSQDTHKGHACVLSCFRHVRLCATPWTVAHQAPLSMGFSRQEYWSRLLCLPPEDLPDPRSSPMSLMSACSIRQILYH